LISELLNVASDKLGREILIIDDEPMGSDKIKAYISVADGESR
jgi:hypothetical protein